MRDSGAHNARHESRITSYTRFARFTYYLIDQLSAKNGTYLPTFTSYHVNGGYKKGLSTPPIPPVVTLLSVAQAF